MKKMDCISRILEKPIIVKTCKWQDYHNYQKKNLTLFCVMNSTFRDESIEKEVVYYPGGCTDKRLLEHDLGIKILLSSESGLGVVMYPDGSATFVDPTKSFEEITELPYARGNWRQVGNSYKFTITEYLTWEQK